MLVHRQRLTPDVPRNQLKLGVGFCRLTNAFSKKLEHHEAACALFVAYYNFVWRTRHADNSGKGGKLRSTAAMMAKITDHLWSFDELFSELLKYGA